MRRVLLFVVGVILTGFGIALSTRPDLGTSSISSLPYVLTYINGWSFGTWTFLSNIVFVILQIILLRRNYKVFQLLQIPCLMLFSLSIDIGMFLANFLVVENYILRLLEVFLGCIILAYGIRLQLVANLLYLPGEGLVYVIATLLKKEIGKIKIFFDSSIVLIAAIVSISCFGEIRGIREGTVIAAIFVGFVIRWLGRFKCLAIRDK